MTIRVKYIRETDKAILYTFKDGSEIWIPKSAIKSKLKWPDGNQEVRVEEWWWNKFNQEDEE